MLIDSKPREFTYIAHKDSIPLELKGNMKKKFYSNLKPEKPSSISFGFKADDRKRFINRVATNYEDLKSILPGQYAAHPKVQKIKTYQTQNHIGLSGVSYLSGKSDLKSNHKEKKHLIQKHDLKEENNRKSEGKKHYNRDHLESQKEIASPKPHPSSLQNKICYDLHSTINRKDRPFSQSVRRNPDMSLFKQGVDLGLEKKRTQTISTAKYSELAGSYSKPQISNSRIMRDDWRRSSFVLG